MTYKRDHLWNTIIYEHELVEDDNIDDEEFIDDVYESNDESTMMRIKMMKSSMMGQMMSQLMLKVNMSFIFHVYFYLLC